MVQTKKEIMIVQVPVLPVVKRYLANSYLLKGNYVLTDTDIVGNKLIQLMQRTPKYWKIARYNDRNYIEVRINVDNVDRLNYINTDASKEFNKFMFKLIKHDFFRFMDDMVDVLGFEINQSIQKFISKFQFDDGEMTFDSLKKLYYRYRRSMEKGLFID